MRRRGTRSESVPGTASARGWISQLEPSTVAGAVIVLSVLLVALAAPWLAPFEPNHINLFDRLRPPTLQHLAGTDEVGRDILSRIIFGARASLSVGLGIVMIGASLGTVLGCIAGFHGGRMDAALMRATDVVMALPGLVIALALTAALGPSLLNAMLALGVLTVPYYMRLARSEALVIRESGYVMASRTMGASSWQQLRRNVLPNALSSLAVYATLNIGTAILAAASLSFVGLGAQPPTPEWGAMVSSGRNQIVDYWWCPLFPGLAIVVTVLGFNLLGDGLRDALDPKTSGRR